MFSHAGPLQSCITRTDWYGESPSHAAVPHASGSLQLLWPVGSVTFGGVARAAGVAFALRACCAAIHAAPTILIFLIAFFALRSPSASMPSVTPVAAVTAAVFAPSANDG